MTAPERAAALARCDELIADLVRTLRPLSHEDRMDAAEFLKSHLKKARVHKCGKDKWLADMKSVKGTVQTSWTEAVRFAREWHANHFKAFYENGKHDS